MARVYLDEDVSVLLASLLSARGIDALTARDAAMLGKADVEHFEFATSTQRVLLTHNRVDFERIYSTSLQAPLTCAGIICLTRKRDVYTLARRVAQFFASHPSLENQLWYL